MKFLKLNNGTFTEVDDEDFERLSHFTWEDDSDSIRRKVYLKNYHINGRRIRKYKRITIQNEILNSDGMFDHIDRNYRNNKKNNLRPCTYSQNLSNRAKMSVNASSKYKGVWLNKKRNKFVAEIKANGVRYHIGSFDNEQEAARAYDTKAKQLHGEFAVLNFP